MVSTVLPPTENVRFGHDPLRAETVPLTVTTGNAAWLTVTVCPATVSVPVRALVVRLMLAEKPTSALPVPLAPDVIVNHDALLRAVQVQVGLVAATLVVREPPASGTDTDAGATVKVQTGAAGGAAAWLNVKVCPLTLRVPDRAAGSVLAATL